LIMTIPDRVPISYEPGHRTGSIGTFDGGQFFGSVTAVIGRDASADDWLRHKRWVEFDGHVFGLIDRSQEYDGQDHAEFVPDDLGFDPPWDGTYDT
jgi:hypothetical protein